LKKSRLKKVLKWILTAFIVYIAGGIALYFFQDKILFHPTVLPETYQYNFSIPFREINLPVTKEKNISIIQFQAPDSLCRGVVLYFHGNMQNINRYAKFATDITKNNYEVWMIDYPGFGKSTGKRSEKILYEDALRLYQMARAKFSPDSIVLYGRSIGTGIASQLAAVRDCKALILETPYYSINALARQYFFIYPVSSMTEYSFPVYRYFEKIAAPIYIFHGTDDEVISYKNSLRLMNSKRNYVELITIEEGKHNNLREFPVFHQKLDSILKM
jgi:pimeloyl-ACP methyl ester carboxylesterase